MDQLDLNILQPWFTRLYGPGAAAAPARYLQMQQQFFTWFGRGGYRIFSAPGRTEIGGNHTDHNNGRVLAAAVSVDTVAFARPNGTNTVRLRSEGYAQPFTVDLSDLSPRPDERGNTAALIRGVAAGLGEAGVPVAGFDAYVTSTVLRGSGLSSSAAFEVLIATVLEGLFGEVPLDPVRKARIAQRAENEFFGKPCGLMDQSASAVGGLITIDFKEPDHAVVEQVPFDFGQTDFQLVVVDTQGSHAALTEEYAAIRREMVQVANYFNQPVLRRVDPAVFYGDVAAVARATSDRAALRAMHFFGDNERVASQVAALKAGDLEGFFQMVIDSGESSWKLLQNCYVGGSVSQGIPLALALSERLLRGRGAWRVHGGGFAGTILAFAPRTMLAQYMQAMNALFGEDVSQALCVRMSGAVEVTV